MKPVVIPGLGKEKTDATHLQDSEDASDEGPGATKPELAARTAARMGTILDKEADKEDEPEPEMSTLYQPGAGEAESSFATMGADDVALDMDIEVGFIADDEESEDDFDDMYY